MLGRAQKLERRLRRKKEGGQKDYIGSMSNSESSTTEDSDR